MKLHHSILLFALALILTGCSATKTSLMTRDPLTQLRKNINSILADSLFVSARASVKVVSLENENVLYERDSKVLMNPGSNMKLFTSAAALSVLDTNYQFTTALFIDALPLDGILTGNLYLKGYGDPDLKASDLDSLALAVRRMGITTIEGDIIVDDSFFDDNYWGAGWNWDDESDPDAPYINALSVNKNCIRITLLTDSTTVYPYLEPMTDFVTVINRAKLTKDSIRTPLKMKRLYLNNPNTIITEGELSWFSQFNQKFSLRNPEYYTGTLFKESLLHAGVFVYGTIVHGVTPIGLRTSIQYDQPIEKIITNMNKVSDNLSAENALKILGTTMTGSPGSAKSGIVVVKRFLSSLGIDTSKLSLVDGSGVSRYNLVSADQLVQFLTAMYKQPRIFPIFYNSLPLAGVDGTLARRMATYPAACNVRAKTGNLKGVSCLSGYVLSRDGEMLVFSIMMQNFTTPSSQYHLVQDRIGSLLAGFSRKSTVQQNFLK